MVNFNEATIKLITNYKLNEHILENNFNPTIFYDILLEENEFCDLISGIKTKEILNLNTNIDEKRQHIEYYTNLYTLMGGTNEGISKENLAKCFKIVFEMLDNPNDLLNSTTLNYKEYKGLAEEVIANLSRNKSELLSPEDFINIMTSNE